MNNFIGTKIIKSEPMEDKTLVLTVRLPRSGKTIWANIAGISNCYTF